MKTILSENEFRLTFYYCSTVVGFELIGHNENSDHFCAELYDELPDGRASITVSDGVLTFTNARFESVRFEHLDSCDLAELSALLENDRQRNCLGIQCLVDRSPDATLRRISVRHRCFEGAVATIRPSA